jgi:hypothetical protein
MKKVLAVVFVVVVAGAFVAGYWPQRAELARTRASAAQLESQLNEAQSRLADAEAKARLGRLLGQLLALQDAVVSGNFGEAQTLSSGLFDGVREQAGKADAAEVRAALDAILARRDTVTAGLARGEGGAVSKLLAPVERDLRRALGYPVAPVPTSARGD